jgi:hypothetical protein
MHTHADAQEDLSADVVPTILPKASGRIAEVRAVPGDRLWVRFNDGTQGTVALSGLVHSSRAGVFAVLRDEALFSQVTLSCGAATWPGELDLAPDAMYDAIRRDGEWVLN